MNVSINILTKEKPPSTSRGGGGGGEFTGASNEATQYRAVVRKKFLAASRRDGKLTFNKATLVAVAIVERRVTSLHLQARGIPIIRPTYARERVTCYAEIVEYETAGFKSVENRSGFSWPERCVC